MNEEEILDELKLQASVIGVAPGCIKNDPKKVTEILQTSITHLILGTYTPSARSYTTGDYPGSSFQRHSETSTTLYEINNGNPGVIAAKEFADSVHIKTRELGKKLVVSYACPYIDGQREEAADEIYRMCIDTKADAINIDLSLTGGLIHGYDPLLLKLILDRLKALKIEVWVTLPYYNIWLPEELVLYLRYLANELSKINLTIKLTDKRFFGSNTGTLAAIADVIFASGNVTTVIAPGPLQGIELNSMDKLKPFILYNDGKSGGSFIGPLTQVFSTPQLSALREMLPSNIKIIAMGGGVESAEGLQKALSCGISGWLLHSQYLQHGAYSIEAALAEYVKFRSNNTAMYT